jgi:carboxypeptidase C (cathepsin A)
MARRIPEALALKRRRSARTLRFFAANWASLPTWLIVCSMMQWLLLRRYFFVFLVFLVAGFAFRAVPEPQASAEAGKESGVAQVDKEGKEKPDKTEKKDVQPPSPVVTEHTVTLAGGKTLSYKAITGYLLLRDAKEETHAGAGSEKESAKENARSQAEPAKGKPKADIFFVAYILNGVADVATRPVTFAFNGGPGSASVWLHMGGLGPRRVQLSDRGEALPPPVKFVDNESTWLDKTDLVFIDPVSTGYSRPVSGEDAKQFHGYKQDIANVGDFIRLWTTQYERWSSPKIIAGESYGTTRAAGLSDYLQNRYGLYVNGIVLISSALNFQTIDFAPGNDVPYPLYLPSYAATAWYHKRLSSELLNLPLREVLNEAESFAAGDYLVALSRGDMLPGPDRDRIADRLGRLTGLSANYLKQLGLRESDDRFVNDLLKDEGRSVGRFDSRFTGIRLNPATDHEDFDPSAEAVNGPFTSAFNDYVRRDLRFETDLPYETIAEVNPWTLAENKYLDVASNLKEAMSRNPYLKVWVCCSYFDLATPYFAAENVVHGMNLDPAIRNNIDLTFYESGHMVYIDKVSREKFKGDFDAFLSRTLTATPVNNAER